MFKNSSGGPKYSQVPYCSESDSSDDGDPEEDFAREIRSQKVCLIQGLIANLTLSQCHNNGRDAFVRCVRFDLWLISPYAPVPCKICCA